MINRRQNSFDGYLGIMRGIAGDEIEYRLKIVGCLGCPTNFGHFKNRDLISS